jgi:hypothetical protein
MTAAPATAATARLRPLWTSLATWSLAGVLVGATLYGLLSERAYRTGSLPGHLLWLGLLGYIAYTYLVYAFGVPHNSAFLLYVDLFAVVIAVCTAILWHGNRQLADPAPGRLRPALWA